MTVTQELLDRIREQLAAGIGEDEIKSSLQANGLREADIAETFAIVSGRDSAPHPVEIVPQGTTMLPGTRALLREAWRLSIQRLGTLLGIMVIPAAVIVGLMALLAGGGIIGSAFLPSQFVTGSIGVLIFLGILAFLVMLVIQAWGQVALLYAIKDSHEGIGVKEAYKRAWPKILSFYWVALLAGSITVGGLLLFIVPGVLFAVWFSLAMFVFIAEDQKGMAALLKSREYVRGKWGAVLWRLFFMGMLSIIVSLVPLAAFSLLQIPFAAEFSRFLITLFLTPLATTYLFLLYSNLRAMKGDVAFAPAAGRKTGFIVAGILGILLIPAILFSTVFFSLNAARGKALDARRESDLQKIRLGLERYHQERGVYPISLDELSPRYLPDAPVDPKTNTGYRYRPESDSNYTVCAELETKEEECVSAQ